jgi:hypothetical protein
MLTQLIENKDPKVLVVTPLWPGHKVTRETRTTIKRNDVPFTWVSFTDYNNIAKNVDSGIKAFKEKTKKFPPYILPLDRDIILGRGMIDKLVSAIEADGLPATVAYCYCSFEFKGHVNRKFNAEPWNLDKLVQANYISSNSLIKSDLLEFIGGHVTDDKYKRLLDWALWLKFARLGFMGTPCTTTSFVAVSTEKDISAGTTEDYQQKHVRVHNDFVKPLIEELSRPMAMSPMTPPPAQKKVVMRQTQQPSLVKVDF